MGDWSWRRGLVAPLLAFVAVVAAAVGVLTALADPTAAYCAAVAPIAERVQPSTPAQVATATPPQPTKKPRPPKKPKASRTPRPLTTGSATASAAAAPAAATTPPFTPSATPQPPAPAAGASVPGCPP